jgi:hypothetical protein
VIEHLPGKHRALNSAPSATGPTQKLCSFHDHRSFLLIENMRAMARNAEIFSDIFKVVEIVSNEKTHDNALCINATIDSIDKYLLSPHYGSVTIKLAI